MTGSSSLDLRTVLAVPCSVERRFSGSSRSGRRKVEPFIDRQIELVKTFADQGVIAIENVHLFAGAAGSDPRILALSVEELQGFWER